MTGEVSTVSPDEMIASNDDVTSTLLKKKKKSSKDDGLGKGSSHKKKSSKICQLDKGSVHKKKKDAHSDDMDKSGHRRKKTASDLGKSTHKKKLKDINILDKVSSEKRNSKDTDKFEIGSTHEKKCSNEKKEKSEGLDIASSHQRKSKETESIDKASRHKKKKEDMDKSSHKKTNSKSKSGPHTSSIHSSIRKRSSSTDKKIKKKSGDEDQLMDPLHLSAGIQQGKKSHIPRSKETTLIEAETSTIKPIIGTRRGKKMELLQEMEPKDDNSFEGSRAAAPAAASKGAKNAHSKSIDMQSESAMDATSCRKQGPQLLSRGEGSDTSDDDSSIASFGEEDDEDYRPFQKVKLPTSQEKRKGTRGPAGVFLSRQNSRDFGRILKRQASEVDIFAALEAEADEIKQEVEGKLPSSGITRSNLSSHQRSILSSSKPRVPPARSQSMAVPKWQPGQQIKPMAAEELREMLKLKGPPLRSQTWRDSPWFRDDFRPSLPLTLAAFPTPTNDSSKLITKANGTVRILRPEECIDMKKRSAVRRSEVKSALMQNLSATIH